MLLAGKSRGEGGGLGKGYRPGHGKELQGVVGHRAKPPSCVKDYTMKPQRAFPWCLLTRVEEEEKERQKREGKEGMI